MNNSLKGALLSGFVFPGLGQVMLKHYKRGAVLILVVTASVLAFLIKQSNKPLPSSKRLNQRVGKLI